MYGVDRLIDFKQADKAAVDEAPFSEHWARFREEHAEQIKALKKLKAMAASYGFDISGLARNAKEAVQWTYFGYLASVKSQDGAALIFSIWSNVKSTGVSRPKIDTSTSTLLLL